MITVQGDTEFASVEQQRHLLASDPPNTTATQRLASWLKSSATAGKWPTF